jgi:hypothetical protein
VGRIFVDTNVLFPFSVMDLLLALTEDSVHEIVWSRALLREWERVIVTWNRSDFPDEPLSAHGVRVCGPDEYLCDLFDAWPDEVLATVVRLAGEKRSPPITPADLAGVLAKAGVPVFAERLRDRLADKGKE